MNESRELPLIGKRGAGKTVKVDPDIWEWARFFPWHLNDRGYPQAFRSAPGHTGRLHRIVMGDPEGCDVHHVSGDLLDARRCNLRVMERSEHLWTRGPYQRRRAATSRYKGVQRLKRYKIPTWLAIAKFDGKYTRIGVFRTEEEAARAYDRAVLERIGPHAYRNFPDEDLAATG